MSKQPPAETGGFYHAATRGEEMATFFTSELSNT